MGRVVGPAGINGARRVHLLFAQFRSLQMKFRVCTSLALGAILAAGALAQTSTAVAYKFTPFTYPGAASTEANGINNAGVIVGTYFDSAGVMHGYRYANGAFSAINFPNAGQTTALGINDQGDIVGWYTISPASGAPPHGYLLHNGAYASIDYPGNQFGTTATGINKNGVIVGNFDNSQGYVLQNGTFTKLDAAQLPGEPVDTVLNGINNLGVVAGQVFSGDNWRGFWTPFNGSDFDFLQPLFALDNEVTGINGRGDVVGCLGGLHPFIAFAPESGEGSESSEKFPLPQMINNPVDATSCPRGINYARSIVGTAGGFPFEQGYLGIVTSTLTLATPANHATVANPVHIAATATGLSAGAQIQVWVNSKEVFHVNGGTLSANINLPVGTNERFVVQAVNSKGVVARIANTLTVR
jgi:hypothetical protein